MWRRLLSRWLSRRPVPAGGREAAAWAATRPGDGVPVLAPAVAAAARSGIGSAVVAGARRPLIDARGEVAGFDFCMPVAIAQRLRERGEAAATAAHASALLAAMRLNADEGLVSFAELPTSWLALPLAREMAPGLMIALRAEDAGNAALDGAGRAAVQAWRAAGAKVGWTDDRPPTLPPDFLLLRGLSGDLARRIEPARRRGVAVVATEIASVYELELALAGGVQLACCAGSPPAETRGMQPLSPQVRRICRLLNRIVQGEDTTPIAEEIKADVGLSYRLLRYLNSAAAGMSREIASIEQAVMLIGRNELYRWLSVLLVRSGSGRPAAAALQEIALARARLLELLAVARRDPAADGLFTLGLASMLPLLLQTTLDEAIAPLNLPAPALEALHGGSGPWHPYLALALQIESGEGGDDDAPAQPFGGWAKVQALAADAWRWARRTSDRGERAGARRRGAAR